jgi:hypothetical protein
MSIAAHGDPTSSDARKRGVVTFALAALAVFVLLGVIIFGILEAVVFPMVRQQEAFARAPHPANNLHAIVLAMHHYHDEYGVFPPAVVSDAASKPLYSGRVLLLPFLGEQSLYNQFDKTRAWDSPENLPLSKNCPAIFQNPLNTGASLASANTGQTDFLFVTGKNTVFEAGKAIGTVNISDDPSNTMAVVEVKTSGVHWAEPTDLDLSQAVALPAGSDFRGNQAAFADGSVRLVPRSVTPGQIRAIATRNGGEPKVDLKVQ